MRILLALLLIAVLPVGQVWAQAPDRLVAQTVWPHREQVILWSDRCVSGWRAQHITQGNRIRWGCWNYNQAGVAVEWDTGAPEYISYLNLAVWHDGAMRQMGYNRLHDRVRLLTFMNP